MALLHLASLPISFTKMLPPHRERKISFIPTKPIHCRASNDVSTNSQIILRRSANFQPSIYHYDFIQSLSSEYVEESYKEQSRVLREEVRMMLGKVANRFDQLELIDVLQRLGVAYHFNNEIMNILDNIYNMVSSSKRKNNLHATTLEFRLLRQHGYDISTDVFVSFIDDTSNFKECHNDDVEGMLSLYEASFYSLEDETILDEARDLTSKILKEYLTKNEGDHLSLLITHALELPLHWRIQRWEAQWFINAYGRRQNMSPAILQLAKLDFNIVQTTYQEELKYVSRWWKSTGFVEKLSFARDRLVESFLWAMGTNFKPDNGNTRKVITKVVSIITIVDDIYDVYGTLEELELFTEAIVKWDQEYAIDTLPDYMKICFLVLYNFVNESAYETLNGHHITPYIKKAWADLCKSYFTEARWYYSGHTPSLEEYMENAWISIGAAVVFNHAYFSTPHSYRKEDLVCLEEYSNIIRSSAVIFRLADDLGSYKRENETGDVPKAIQCYMNDNGTSEEDACDHLKSMICTRWKKLNEEVGNSSMPQSFVDNIVNLARTALCFYQRGDGHTIQASEINTVILSLIIQPIGGN